VINTEMPIVYTLKKILCKTFANVRNIFKINIIISITRIVV